MTTDWQATVAGRWRAHVTGLVAGVAVGATVAWLASGDPSVVGAALLCVWGAVGLVAFAPARRPPEEMGAPSWYRTVADGVVLAAGVVLVVGVVLAVGAIQAADSVASATLAGVLAVLALAAMAALAAVGGIEPPEVGR